MDVLVAILPITLLALYWLQPVIHTMLTLMLALTTKQQQKSRGPTAAATITWFKVLSEKYHLLPYLPLMCADAIARRVCSTNTTQRRRRWRMPAIGWITKSVYRQAERLGNWIERNCQSTGTNRGRRIWRAVSTRRTSTRARYAMSILAMQASATIAKEREVRFDTDSSHIGVDNRCSACISHDATDFEIGTLKPCNRIVKGFGGSRVTNVQVRTLNWRWEDDNGVSTTFRIPNSYYVPEGNVRLLSPQHWAQTQAATRQSRGKYGERTDGNECVLYWDNAGKRQRRIPLSRHKNVATLTLASGYTCFEAFCNEAGILEPTDEILALPIGLISDDEDDNASVAETEDGDEDDRSVEPMSNEPTPVDSAFKDTATPVEFDLNGPTTPASEGERTAPPTSTINIISDEEDRQSSDLAELLMLHQQHGHISMRKLQEMAKQGIIPKRLAKCRIPTCSACLYSKATKKPWRGKESKGGNGKEKPTRPGQVVSVDHLVSRPRD